MPLEIWLLSVVSVITVLVMLTFILLILLYLTTDPYPAISRDEIEQCFLNPNTSEYIKFPFGLTERAEVELSVIIPAYNESLRLPVMMDETLAYLDKRKEADQKFSYEVIVVDDGSTDDTTKVALKYSESHGTDSVRVLKLSKNRGKGGAVQLGILSARGRILLFADADGATRFSDIEVLEKALSRSVADHWNGSMSLACGSRAHLEPKVTVKRSPLRNALMYGFKLFVWLVSVRGIQDTQCGFKLFSRPAARLLFHNLHVQRWAFDVDLLYLAGHFKMIVCEVPVNWKEVDGSKIIPVFSWLQMAKDLLLIRLRYSLGAWKVENVHI